MPAAPPLLHIPLPSLPQDWSQKPTPYHHLTPITDEDDSELKEFFFGLHVFKSDFESGTSSPSSDSTLVLDDDEEIWNVFTSDKESYDFESQLPPSTVLNIQEMLDEPDVYDSRFGDNHKELNPQAPPFVPTQKALQTLRPPRPPLSSIIRDRVLAASGVSPFPTPPETTRPTASWVAIFQAASSAPANSEILTERATELAHSTFWHPAALAELAQHFCWKASAANSDVARESMAPFAWEVFCALWDAFDEDTAKSFVWHLRESVIGTFKGCWSTAESSKAISYRFTPSEEYIASANWLTAFVGSLFTFNLVHAQHIKMCLSILVHELASLEHITAVSILIEHAGPALWRYPGSVADPVPISRSEPSQEMVHLFLRSFLPKTASLQNGSSVVAKIVVAGTREKDAKVQGVMDILAQWCPDLRAI
ncbi:hypothetical protein GYMLUDRAFT_34344 [Collybiopsis luxurians FD-317 M1]|nr:hypothetical protein GYMLUDRAFT_34344 [Collybiopsis luxurians FD-317 M1]